MFSKDCCAIFHWHYFTFSHKKNISETVPNSVHIGECTIPVLNIYIYIYLHFKYKIEISHNKNILIYKSSRINYVAMIIYVQCPDLKYCYLKNIDTKYWKPDNLYKAQYLSYSDIIYFDVFSYYNIMFACIHVCLVIMYLLLINLYNHKICVPTFTQTPFIYQDTSAFRGAIPIICFLCTLQNTFNKNFLIVFLCIPWKCDSVIYLNTFFPFLCITLLFKLLIKIVVGFSQYFIVCSIRCILTNFCYNLLINLHSHIYIYKCSETHHMIWPTVICPPTIPCRLTVFSYMTHNYHLTIILITSSITKLFLNQPYLHFPLFQFILKIILSIEISINKTHVHDSNIIILYDDSSIRVHKLILFYMYMYNTSVLIRNILPRKLNVDTDVGLHGNLTICLAIHLHLTFSILYISISVPSVFTCVYLILLPTCIVNVVELTRVRCYSRKQLISFLKRISESIIGHYDVFPIFHYLLEHTSLKRSPYLNWRGCSCRPTTLHPNHDVRQACEIILYYNNALGNIIIPIYILLCVFLAYKCLLCMCSEYVQRTGQYFYRSNFNPLIITHNSNSNLLRKCQPKLEVQTLCYKIKYLKVNF